MADFLVRISQWVTFLHTFFTLTNRRLLVLKVTSACAVLHRYSTDFFANEISPNSCEQLEPDAEFTRGNQQPLCVILNYANSY